MTKQYDKFDHMMDKLLKVPHSEIKAKLDAEKAAKVQGKSAKQKAKECGITKE
jgi:hypothetical protein